MSSEQNLEDRDSTGLQPMTEKTATEKAEMIKYLKMLLFAIPFNGQIFAWSIYFCCSKLLGQEELYSKKFALLHEYQLGFVYFAVWVIAMARVVLVCNANGARAPARVDRPDQHVYKIMTSEGPLKDAAYVLMASTGPQGRFNRAQRGVFNTDESMPLVMVNILLAGAVFGPVVLCLCLFVAYGRVTFGLKYKESTKSRGAGFLPAMIGEKWIEGLVLLCAIKSVFYTSLPF